MNSDDIVSFDEIGSPEQAREQFLSYINMVEEAKRHVIRETFVKALIQKQLIDLLKKRLT